MHATLVTAVRAILTLPGNPSNLSSDRFKKKEISYIVLVGLLKTTRCLQIHHSCVKHATMCITPGTVNASILLFAA